MSFRRVLDMAALSQVDPREFVARFNDAMQAAALRRMALLMGGLNDAFAVADDRERLIDEARD